MACVCDGAAHHHRTAPLSLFQRISLCGRCDARRRFYASQRSGAYFLPAGAHTWALKKVNGASSYPDAAMKVYFTALTYDHAENADHTHTTAEVKNALTAAEVEATAIFTSETSSEKASGSSMRPTAVLNNIIFDNANEVTTIMLVVDSGSGGYYGIFTEHQPWEFDVRPSLPCPPSSVPPHSPLVYILCFCRFCASA